MTEKVLYKDASCGGFYSAKLIDSCNTGSLSDLVNKQYLGSAGPREDNRTDHVNFRLLMWKAMASFPDVAENRSRDIVPLLLRFIRCVGFVDLGQDEYRTHSLI